MVVLMTNVVNITNSQYSVFQATRINIYNVVAIFDVFLLEVVFSITDLIVHKICIQKCTLHEEKYT